jgi:hypothetical protein
LDKRTAVDRISVWIETNDTLAALRLLAATALPIACDRQQMITQSLFFSPETGEHVSAAEFGDQLSTTAYIAEHDPAAAKRVALHILYCVEYLLLENPKLGAPRSHHVLQIGPVRPSIPRCSTAAPRSRARVTTLILILGGVLLAVLAVIYFSLVRRRQPRK